MSLKYIVTILFIVLLHIYLYIRGWQALSLNKSLLYAYSFIIVVVSAALISDFVYRTVLPHAFSVFVRYVAGFWKIFFVWFLFTAILSDFFRVLNYYFNLIPLRQQKFNRLKLYYFTSVFFIFLFLSVTGVIRSFHTNVVRLNISVNKSGDGSEIKIVTAGDLHIGDIMGEKKLAGWIEIMNKQNADVILFTGDIFDRNFQLKDSARMIKEFKKLRSEYGIFAVPGNHEYYLGIDFSEKILESSGITLLKDEVICIGNRLIIAGRDDATNKNRKLLRSLLDGIDRSLSVVVMNHQPSNLYETVQNNADLQVSGHLHDGQIFPYNLFLSGLWELSYGYRKIKNSHFYVTSGTGLRIAPVRIGTKSEIVSIILTPNDTTATLIGESGLKGL